MSERRRSWIRAVLAALAPLVVCAGGCAREDGPEPWNVILVTLDTTRADRISCYAEGPTTTPHFDALAREGVRFDLAIAQAAVTPVSHASILTGLNPQGHGLRVMHAARAFRLDPAIPSLPQLLQSEGWHTAAFLSSFTVSEHFGFDVGFDHFDNGLTKPADEVMRPLEDGRYGWNFKANQRRSDETTDRALEWIQTAREPYFAWIHYWDPHDTGLLPPGELLKEAVSLEERNDEILRDVYDLEVQYVDAQFGRLMEVLRASGQQERTVIVVVADHGEGLNDHGWWHHRILYQEQIHVPMILKFPGGPTGATVPDLVRTVDILPTILELLRIPAPDTLDGESMVPLVQGESREERVAYADQLNLFDLNASLVEERPRDDLLYCAMDRTWKLVYRPLHPELNELYHLGEDPREQENRYSDTHPQARRLLEFLEASGGFVDEPFGESVDAETLERLRALGYTGG